MRVGVQEAVLELCHGRPQEEAVTNERQDGGTQGISHACCAAAGVPLENDLRGGGSPPARRFFFFFLADGAVRGVVVVNRR